MKNPLLLLNFLMKEILVIVTKDPKFKTMCEEIFGPS